MLRTSSWVVVTVLIFAAVDELVLALTNSSTPADGALPVGFFAMLAAFGLVFAKTRVASLLLPAAGLFVTARFYTQDPSYSGFHRTFAMNGIPQASWVYFLLVVSLVAGAIRYRTRLGGAAAGVIVLLLLLFTAIVLYGAGY